MLFMVYQNSDPEMQPYSQVQLSTTWSGKRGEVLEKMCQDSLGDFARNLGQLVALNARFNQIVDLNSRYKDYLSTIWSLQDSRNSIYQNTTIQKLTYLTIGYLPLGLITVISLQQYVYHSNLPRSRLFLRSRLIKTCLFCRWGY